MLLAGDVGGTKTHLGLYVQGGSAREPQVETTLSSANYPTLEALVGEFLAQTRLSVERASLGVAGPVVAGRAHITNLPWVLEEARLQQALGIKRVRLLNDLTALAHAVPYLEPSDLCTLNRGQPVLGGALGVVAPGTGLGEAFLAWDGSRYRACPSEGGHSDFAPTTPLEGDLWHYLRARMAHVSYELVCSGKGLPNIYAFLRDTARSAEPEWLAVELARAADPTPIIVKAALECREGCEICVDTLDIFVSVLGAEAGNLALRVLATGGMYLGGGIPPRILSALQSGCFMAAFRSKGRMSDLLTQVPVYVILNDSAPLLGAARHVLEG
jgi:glucokinase